MKLNLKQAAISLGILFGILHFVTVIFITQTNGKIINWWMASHHMQITYTTPALSVLTLIFGTISAAVIGAILGVLFVVIWNTFSEVESNEK